MRNGSAGTVLGGAMLLLAAGLATLALPAQEAEARSRVGVGVGIGVYAPPPYYYPRYYPPYYYYPPPPPAYYYPPPAYYYPPPAPPQSSANPTQSQAYCREYTATTTINGHPEKIVGTACLQPDGTWRIVR